MEEGDLEKAVKDVLGNDEESLITDYILPFKIAEYLRHEVALKVVSTLSRKPLVPPGESKGMNKVLS